jgi:hypothetical protein
MGGRGEWRGDPGTKQGGANHATPTNSPFLSSGCNVTGTNPGLITRTTRGRRISVRSLQRASPGLEEVKDLNEQGIDMLAWFKDR